MAHFDENPNFYPTIPTVENFNIYPHFYPMPDTGAGNIQPLDNFENSRNLAEQCGFLFDPLTVGPVPNSYGKHHDHRLVDRCLPRCLQTGRSQKSHIRSRAKTTLSQCTLANTYRKSNLNLSSAVSQDGTVASLPGWPRNHLLSSRPPATVRTFLFRTPKSLNSQRLLTGPLGCLGENTSGYPFNTLPEVGVRARTPSCGTIDLSQQ